MTLPALLNQTKKVEAVLASPDALLAHAYRPLFGSVVGKTGVCKSLTEVKHETLTRIEKR